MQTLLNTNNLAKALFPGTMNAQPKVGHRPSLIAHPAQASVSAAPAKAASSKPEQFLASMDSERLHQQLSLRSASYRLEIESPDGRRASLALDYASVDFQQTYTRVGTLVGSSRGPSEDSRMASAREFLAQHGQAAYLGVSASSLKVEIDGDQDLLREYFAAAPTAQRIFDMTTGLGKDLGTNHPGFAGFSAAITRGISEGFAQAQALLGGTLASVSEDTRTLLDAMLAHFSATGESVKADDFLSLLNPKEKGGSDD